MAVKLAKISSRMARITFIGPTDGMGSTPFGPSQTVPRYSTLAACKNWHLLRNLEVATPFVALPPRVRAPARYRLWSAAMIAGGVRVVTRNGLAEVVQARRDGWHSN